MPYWNKPAFWAIYLCHRCRQNWLDHRAHAGRKRWLPRHRRRPRAVLCLRKIFRSRRSWKIAMVSITHKC